MAGAGVGLTYKQIQDWVDNRFGKGNTFNVSLLNDFQAQVILAVKAQGKDRCNGPHFEQLRYSGHPPDDMINRTSENMTHHEQ